MALKIEVPPANTITWEEAKEMHVYRSPSRDLLVLAAAHGKAIALQVAGVTGSTPGNVWSPGEKSTWVEVDATLIVGADVK